MLLCFIYDAIWFFITADQEALRTEIKERDIEIKERDIDPSKYYLIGACNISNLRHYLCECRHIFEFGWKRFDS